MISRKESSICIELCSAAKSGSEYGEKPIFFLLVSGISPESEICLACFSNVAASDSAPVSGGVCGRAGAGYLLRGQAGRWGSFLEPREAPQKGSRPPSEARVGVRRA